MTCSNRPCDATVTVEDCALVRDENTLGRLIPLCRVCAPLFVTAHPDRFTRIR